MGFSQSSLITSIAKTLLAALLRVTVFVSLSAYAENPPPQPKHMPSQKTILDCAKLYTGFDESYDVESIEAVPLSELSIPFLSSKLNDETGIRIRFAPGKIKWRPPLNGTEDFYERHISVFLDADAKGLIGVTIRLAARPPDIQVLPLQKQEERIRKSDTIYESFPTVAPKISFLQALAAVQARGQGQLFMAREIDGFFLNLALARDKWESKPLWIIIRRGIPPMSMPGIPGIKATFMLSWVDPVTGKFIGEGQHGGPGF